jgi:hypothetical protein
MKLIISIFVIANLILSCFAQECLASGGKEALVERLL